MGKKKKKEVKTEKEKIQEKLDSVINKDFLKTPQQLAVAYLSNIIGSKSLSSALQNTVYHKFLPSRIFEEAKKLGAPEDETKELFKQFEDDLNKELSDLRKHYRKNLSNETIKLLKENNYSTSTKNIILDMLIDFEKPIVFYATASRRFKKHPEISASLKKHMKKVIESCNFLEALSLEGHLLTDHERKTIEGIRKRSETFIKNMQKIELTPMKEYELFCLSLTPGIVSRYDPIKWHSELFYATLSIDAKRQPGERYDIFFKGLQICIYKILIMDKPERELAKKLTAEIINDCYNKLDFLKKLTAKDIDNAVHFP